MHGIQAVMAEWLAGTPNGRLVIIIIKKEHVWYEAKGKCYDTS